MSTWQAELSDSEPVRSELSDRAYFVSMQVDYHAFVPELEKSFFNILESCSAASELLTIIPQTKFPQISFYKNSFFWARTWFLLHFGVLERE